MKKMILSLLLLFAGLSVCGYLVHRHHRRTISATPPPEAKPSHQPMNSFQRKIMIDTRTDYAGGSKAERELHEKLRQEELRQRPEEGRN